MEALVHVLYSIVGETEHEDGHFNAFILPCGPDESVSLKMIQTHFPLGPHFHFSFKTSEHFIDLFHPSAIIPKQERKIIMKVFPLEKNPMPKSVLDKNETSRPNRPRVIEKERRVSIERDSGDWKTLKAGLTDLSGQAFDIAKNLKLKDAKKTAKKWTGSLFSSISSSISQASNALRGESVTVGRHKVIVQKQLAEGGFSQVFQVSSGQEMYAMKRIVCQSTETARDVEMEIHVHKSVHHPNIMALVDAEDTNREFLLLFPLYTKGSLWDAIDSALKKTRKEWPFHQRRCLDLFHSLCKAVTALHEHGWAHRDIKPHNVLLDDQNQPILMDLGSCARLSMSIETRRDAMLLQEEADSKCSAPYRAPELFDVPVPSSIDGQVDVWSLGCTLYCMAFGTSPFESPREGFMKLACLNGNVRFPPNAEHRGQRFSDGFCQFIQDMLNPDPHERPSLFDLLDITQDLNQ